MGELALHSKYFMKEQHSSVYSSNYEGQLIGRRRKEGKAFNPKTTFRRKSSFLLLVLPSCLEKFAHLASHCVVLQYTRYNIWQDK